MIRRTVQQGPSDTATCAVRTHRYLLDVQVAVQWFGDEVGHRRVGVIDGDPGQAGLLVASKFTDGKRRVIGDLRHTDIPETPPGGPFYVLQEGQFVDVCCSDSHGAIVRADHVVRPPSLPEAQVVSADWLTYEATPSARCGPHLEGPHGARPVGGRRGGDDGLQRHRGRDRPAKPRTEQVWPNAAAKNRNKAALAVRQLTCSDG